jgi:predicted DNA-binding protein
LRRTQIYLSDEQERALVARARMGGRTKSALIREAIDTYLRPAPAEDLALTRLQVALREAAGIAPHLPPGKEYVEEIRRRDTRRAREQRARRLDPAAP